MFFTLTSILENHPVIAPILEPNEKAVAKCSDEERLAAPESYMVTNSVVPNSSTFHRLPAEKFGQTVANYPYDSDESWAPDYKRILKSWKSWFKALRKLFLLPLVVFFTAKLNWSKRESWWKWVHDSVRMHTRDCAVVNYRCMKQMCSTGEKMSIYSKPAIQLSLDFRYWNEVSLGSLAFERWTWQRRWLDTRVSKLPKILRKVINWCKQPALENTT